MPKRPAAIKTAEKERKSGIVLSAAEGGRAEDSSIFMVMRVRERERGGNGKSSKISILRLAAVDAAAVHNFYYFFFFFVSQSLARSPFAAFFLSRTKLPVDLLLEQNIRHSKSM